MKKLVLSTALLVSFSLTQAVQAHPEHAGHLTESADSHVKTGFGGCWRLGNWKEDDVHCGGEPVAVAPPPPQFVMQAAQRSHIVYFDFDSSAVNDVSDIVDTVNGLTNLDTITLTGHADKLGANGYNDQLSRKRVNAVADALVAAGVDPSKIITGARGETVPVKSCSGSANMKQCLAANRRVEVSINGERRVQVQ